jgi:hypothetical protein
MFYMDPAGMNLELYCKPVYCVCVLSVSDEHALILSACKNDRSLVGLSPVVASNIPGICGDAHYACLIRLLSCHCNHCFVVPSSIGLPSRGSRYLRG